MSQVLTVSRSRSTRKGARRAEMLEGASEYSSIGRLADRAALALIRHQASEASTSDDEVLRQAVMLLATSPDPARGERLHRPFRGVVGFSPIDLVEEVEAQVPGKDWIFDDLGSTFMRVLDQEASPHDYDLLLAFLSGLSAATLKLSDEALTSKLY